MARDYSRAVALAQRLILDAGRLVNFQKFSTTALDAADPLAGPAAPPAPVLGVPAAFVAPSGVTSLGASSMARTLFKECEQIALVAEDGVNDFRDFDLLIDSDGLAWTIVHVELLQPGPARIMYYVGIKRP